MMITAARHGAGGMLAARLCLHSCAARSVSAPAGIAVLFGASGYVQRRQMGSKVGRGSPVQHGRKIPPAPKSEEPYTLYGLHTSYYTGKVETGFHLYPFPWKYQSNTAMIRKRNAKEAGTHLIPIVKTNDGKWLKDSTAIYDHLDRLCSKYGKPHMRMFPEGVAGVQVHVIEEYFDEWFSRHAINWRWNMPASTESGRAKIAEELLPNFWEIPFRGYVAKQINQWGNKACKAFGLEYDEQQADAFAESIRVWEALEKQLASTKYALGDAPCAVDTVLIGGFRAHFLMDPDPRAGLSDMKNIIAWSDLGNHPKERTGTLAPFPESTPFAQFILKEMRDGPFRDFILANEKALRHGEKGFKIMVAGRETSFRARWDVENARRYVRERVVALRSWSPEAHKEANNWLRSVGMHDLYGDD